MSDSLTPPPPPPPPPTVTAVSAASAYFDSSTTSSLLRDYRKGNWTVQETLTLITAKRLDDDRRSSVKPSAIAAASPATVAGATPRSAEQRWKWVENYCWRHGCLRSQNQCNDKWDNLLRDYKKVRDYEMKMNQEEQSLEPIGPNARPNSYWALERHQRKERNLPTNLSPEVFEALTDVLSRRNARRSSAASATPISSLPPPPPPLPPPPPPPPPPPIQPQPSVSGMMRVKCNGGKGYLIFSIN